VIPKTRSEFWSAKRGGNVERDTKHAAALEAAGWKVLTIWECETRNDDDLRASLQRGGLALGSHTAEN
jgi:DNA mismatch endonuclease (patch repair protein)